MHGICFPRFVFLTIGHCFASRVNIRSGTPLKSGIGFIVFKLISMEFIGDLKIIWRFLSKYKRQVYVIFAVAILASMIEAMVPYIYGRIVDLIIANESISVIFLILFFWLAFSFIKDWAHRYVTREGGMVSIKCAGDLIADLNRHAMRLELNFHKSQKTGKLASKYIRASDFLELIINEIIFTFGSDLLTVALVYMVIVSIDLKIALFLGLAIVFYLWVTVRRIDTISQSLIKMIDSYEEGDAIMHDSVANIQVVKSNINEDYEDSKARKSLDTSYRRFRDFIRTWSALDAYQQLIISVTTVLLFGFLVVLKERGLISIGQIVTIIGYTGLIFTPLRRISQNLERFKRSIGVVKKALKLFDEKTEPYQKTDAVRLKAVKGKVEFKDVSFFYQDRRQILNDITFSVLPGQVVALVGESGVGKTTLMDLLSRYNNPSSGKILLDGVDIKDIDLRDLREQIAIVPQELSLFNDTIKNNIIYAKLDASEHEIQEAVKAANAHEFINSFPKKLDQEVGERGIKLSTGQKQRVAIARAILKNPKILILDEATSALDSKSELLVQSALKKLIKGRTTFVIAHRLSTIMHANKIIVLDKGIIVESGKHQELIKKRGLYHKLFSLQSLGEAGEEEV